MFWCAEAADSLLTCWPMPWTHAADQSLQQQTYLAARSILLTSHVTDVELGEYLHPAVVHGRRVAWCDLS